ncbi:MAG TPA: alpha/beta hydrolase [Nocardioides sp.]|uniref:alpha/beta fold hydrolase n=1 Tax=Nocardioides sp. TaxID=35761 RepID=UPI002E351824|nr:alpha/beta hydrolase [Nocardioides sp.]HEX5088636.1 alpha/beta hydrolase [Nocardioides sp.]
MLIHGAWHDARCWEQVTAILDVRGHSVTTPTLTGLGLRSDELTATVGLDTHVADVVSALGTQGSPDLVVVAHSYGAVVARQALDQHPAAARGLVLVEGWILDDGQSMASVAPEWFMPAMSRSARDAGDGWRVPPPPPAAFGIEGVETARLLGSLVSDHPLRTFSDPTRLTGAVDSVPAAAIVGRPGPVPFRQWAEDHGLRTFAVDTGHDAMLTAPCELVDVIEKAVAALP